MTKFNVNNSLSTPNMGFHVI